MFDETAEECICVWRNESLTKNSISLEELISCNRGDCTIMLRGRAKRWHLTCFGQFWHEWVDLFLEVLLTLLTSWVDLFLEVLTESHAKKLEPEVKQLFSCVRFESNCRFFKYSIHQLSPVVREFQSWRKLMDSFLKTRWWLMQTTFGVGKQGNRKIANCFLLHHRWWSSSWNTRATLWSGAKNLSCASRSVQTFVYSAKRERQRRWQKQRQKQR